MAVPHERLTSTGYGVLALLTLGDWSAYDLAGLMARSLGHLLPRSASVVYEEPKRLVRKGLVTVRSEQRGQRDVAVYSLTDEGRAVLRQWLADPSLAVQLEAEPIAKALFAEHGTREDLVAIIRAVKDDARRRLRAIAAQGRGYQEHGGPFPERLPWIALTGAFAYQHLQMLYEWSTWAEEEVLRWPVGPDGRVDAAALTEWAQETIAAQHADFVAAHGEEPD